MEPLSIGFIKCRFPIDKLSQHKKRCIDLLVDTLEHVRRTPNSVFVQLGHENLPDNDIGREWVRECDALGGRITRVDFSIDLSTPFDFVAYKAAMDLAYQQQTMQKKIGLPSLWTSLQGNTVYIGKRRSSRCFRVYDKRAEILAKKHLDIGFDMTRFEIECKKEAVRFYLPLFMSYRADVIVADLAWRYNLPMLADAPERYVFVDDDLKDSSPWAFVYRFRRVIRKAYNENPDMFVATIKEN